MGVCNLQGLRFTATHADGATVMTACSNRCQLWCDGFHKVLKMQEGRWLNTFMPGVNDHDELWSRPFDWQCRNILTLQNGEMERDIKPRVLRLHCIDLARWCICNICWLLFFQDNIRSSMANLEGTSLMMKRWWSLSLYVMYCTWGKRQWSGLVNVCCCTLWLILLHNSFDYSTLWLYQTIYLCSVF